MTGDADVHREASVEVSLLNGKVDDECGTDGRARQDLVKSAADCNGVSRREADEEAIDDGTGNGNGNGQDDADATYVFVKGSEAAGEGVGSGFVGADLREESVEGKASDIDVGGSKASAENGNCDVEPAAVNRENGDGERELVNGENGDRHSDEHIVANEVGLVEQEGNDVHIKENNVVNEVELLEQEGNGAHIKENNEETVVDEAETDAGHGKTVDLNDGECHVEDHLMDNGTGGEDSQGEFIESTLAGSTSAEEQNREADIVGSPLSKQHEGEFHIDKQTAVESSLEVSDEFSGLCDATVAASKFDKTFEVPQADEADSSGQMGRDQESSLEVEPSLESSEQLSGSCDVIVVASECERTSEVPQADQSDSSGQVDGDQKSELKIVDSGEGEVVLKIDDEVGNEDEKVMEESISCPDVDTEQNPEPERTFEVPQADQADSSGQVDEDQKSELTNVDSGEGEVGKIDDSVCNEDEKVMEESISCPDVDTEQNPEPEVILTKDLVSDKENSLTKMGDDSSSEAAPEDISNTIATADTRAGPFSDDTGDVEPTATAPDPIASENVEHEAVTDTLDTSQEINEEAHTSENTESTPSSVSCGNVPVQIELEEANAEESQTGVPQCVDANLEVREENDSTVVDVTSSCSATNLSAITEICFGSISQKEISSIPSDNNNAEPKVSNSLSLSTGSHHTDTTESPSNDTAEIESFSAQDSKSGLKNELDAVLDEKREDQSTIENDKPAFSQAECVDVVAQNDAAPAEVSGIPASEEQNVGSELEKKLFNVLVKIPRYDDENLKQQINEAQLQVTEKTQSRDAIQAEIQIIKAACKEHSDKIEVALSEENAARELFKSKREEIESVQSVINKVKNAITVGDYDVRIQNMEQKIQHETLPLKEEKQLIRDIKQLKYSREQLTNDMGGLDELKLALDRREQTEERLKSLRREADLLRENVLKAEAVTKSAKRIYSNERDRLRELQGRFRDADKIRQEAYIHLKNLRKQSSEKNKFFWKYKDDVKMSIDLASRGDREALSRFCIDQVETFMELWNRSSDFREEYLKCNAPRTLRRLGTADGRSLGPNEAMPAIPTAVNQTAVKDKSMSALPSIEQEKVPVVVEARPAADDKLSVKEVEQKKQKAKNKSSAKPVAQVEDLVTVSSRDVVNVEMEEPKLSKEEEELAKKAEELRKAEEAAVLMEQRRLEEKAKAKEALERKKRSAERALARAVSKAQKEAEQKEKEREKKAKKKERKKAGGAIATPSDAGIEGEAASETAEAPADFDTKDKPAVTVKRSQKPLHFVKQTKVKPIPPTLRNRSKRKMQPWMWAVLAVLLVFALFMVSNGWNLF
ncbi:stress response protein NST1 isoform X2 [Syzygium oleosum]|uniref:stress response protein NST1 isoform X2 n=1 Tax=Syzygium oleosum TaxID=219896 RepID=UPI0024BBB48D|nr:stress response protein NST1 isoform X2 [Syzygium oleosum]